MDCYRKVRAQQDQVDDGTLKVSVFTEDGTRPVENALVRISYTGESGQTVDEVRTDSSGQTPVLDLKTPPLEYSMEPVEEQPYAEYTIQVEAEGFENTEIAGTQVLPGVQAQQAVKMAFRGGIEEGGVDLWRSGDIYRTVTYDDYPVYYMMGELVLPVDDSVTLSDSSASVDAVPVETSGIIEVGKAVSEDKDNWTPYNTTVFTKDGAVSNILRIWVP